MEIYVRAYDKDYGCYAWYNYDDEDGSEYLYDGKELEAEGSYEDFLRGTPCKSVADAKHAASRAKTLMNDDGYPTPVIEMFARLNGKFRQVRITRDGRVVAA